MYVESSAVTAKIGAVTLDPPFSAASRTGNWWGEVVPGVWPSLFLWLSLVITFCRYFKSGGDRESLREWAQREQQKRKAENSRASKAIDEVRKMDTKKARREKEKTLNHGWKWNRNIRWYKSYICNVINSVSTIVCSIFVMFIVYVL